MAIISLYGISYHHGTLYILLKLYIFRKSGFMCTEMLPDWEDYRLVSWSVNTELRKLPQQKCICDFGQVINLPHMSILFVWEHCY